MKQQANLIRAGQVIEHEGRRWTVLKQQIITPGKGGAFIQVEMRDLKIRQQDQRALAHRRYRRAADDRGQGVHLLLHRRQQPGADGPRDVRADAYPGRPAGRCRAPSCRTTCRSTVDLVEGEIRSRVHLPPTVVLEVVEADPVVKGQTAASSYKPAKLSNGVKTSVPPFIETGRADRGEDRGRAAT